MPRFSNAQKFSRVLVCTFAVHVGHRVVDDPMGVFAFQSIVGEQRVSVERRTGFYVLSNFSLERVLLSVRNNNGTHLAATLYDAENWSLVLAASPSDAAFTSRNVHIPRLAADEGFIRFNMAAGLLNGAAVERH